MRAVVQRVKEATVFVDGEAVGHTDKGLLVLCGFTATDTEQTVDWVANRIVKSRIFPDENGKLNLSLIDIGGGILCVSNFTLYADCRKGNRPSFTNAGAPDESKRLYELFVERARQDVAHVACGEFGADMQVTLVNDGPFTICLDTDDLARPRK